MRRLVTSLPVLVVLLATSSASAAIKHWGAYGAGGFGVAQTPTVVPLPPEAGTIVKIDGGNAASYALSSAGTVWSVGKNGHGQLGDGTKSKTLTPVEAKFPAGTKIVAIGEGRSVGFAVDSTGQAWSWGRAPNEAPGRGEGDDQSLCLGHQRNDVLTPQPIPGLTKVRGVQGGATHVVWLMENGTVETCGANTLGQLGIGSSEPQASPTPVVVTGLSDVVEVSAGQATSCARTATGEVYVWGGDAHGQVGNGQQQETGISSPFHVPLPGKASEISCGGNYLANGSTLALVGGLVYGWGDNEKGQLGDGTTTDKASPTLSSQTILLGLKQVVTSGAYSLGVTGTGEVYGWGSNEEFTLAAPRKVKFSPAPLLIDTGASEVSGTAFDSVDR
jgi:alpha-tubulin suppressor-like RCC1 family protein